MALPWSKTSGDLRPNCPRELLELEVTGNLTRELGRHSLAVGGFLAEVSGFVSSFSWCLRLPTPPATFQPAYRYLTPRAIQHSTSRTHTPLQPPRQSERISWLWIASRQIFHPPPLSLTSLPARHGPVPQFCSLPIVSNPDPDE
jgi:hypothetical protein